MMGDYELEDYYCPSICRSCTNKKVNYKDKLEPINGKCKNSN